MRNEIFIIIFVFLLFILIGNFASKGILDLFGKVTGKATQQDTNVTVTVTGTNAITVTVFNSTIAGTVVDPTEDSFVLINFTVNINDADGSSDINTTSVRANFSRIGEVLRENLTCLDLNQNTATSKNFSCTIDMWYFDQNAVWNITAGGTDLGNKTFIFNTSTTFRFNQLQGIKISPNQITFNESAPGATNKTSDNDPTLLNNTGNYNFTNITVNAINLYSGSNFIDVRNMTVGNNTGSNAECGPPSTATLLTNGTDTQIINTILTRGNHTANNGQTGQEQTYYCFQTIPSNIPSGTYATNYSTTRAWRIIGTT